MTDKQSLWVGPPARPTRDDFGRPITDRFVDGRTKVGPWAIMIPESWAKHGVGKLGTGCGQEYVLADDGRFYKSGG